MQHLPATGRLESARSRIGRENSGDSERV